VDFPGERLGNNASFNTTRWTMVLACAEEDSSATAQAALASLFQVYWYPLYAYVRRRGYGEQDAEDLVQGFCLHLQEKHALAKADRERGKFRTFLLSSLQNYLANEWERANAQKRGGGRELIRLDAEEADARYRLEPAHSMTPEVLFEKRWAHALLEQTVSDLRADFVARGKERLFEGLSSFLTADLHETSYQSAAAKLGLPLSAIKTTIHRLRRDYRAKLREQIGRTVADPEEIEDELLYLRKVVASAGS
jgi:RNA polymerase sigma factor (sigma-70 family)